MKQKFDPQVWLNKKSENSDQDTVGSGDSLSPSPHHSIAPSDTPSQVDAIITRIEQAMTDLTANYSDWLSLGFAFANEYGEAGRSYYHRISRFYPQYTVIECDKQYDQCLKAKGHGITIKSFFHLAKEAGIEVRSNREEKSLQEPPPFAPWPAYMEKDEDKEEEPVVLPNLPESIYAELPEFIGRIVSIAGSKDERDVLLLGSIVVLGACMPNMYGIYDGNKVFPCLYLFVTSKASAGKGRLNCCLSLVNPVHYALRREAYRLQQEYENKMREYNIERLKDPNAEKPEKPPEKMLLIPANCSATGMFQLLAENDGQGLIFETEGDTLSMTFKTDHGNYSDGYRKGFHHERISYYRRTDHELKQIDKPRISTVLGGTYKQVASLIPDAENGLMSRFIFYYMNVKITWKDVFSPAVDNGIEEHFEKLGFEYFKLYEALKESDAIRFCFTQKQKNEFNAFFSQIQEKYLTLQGSDYLATIRRLGLIAFRIAMILNGLRIMETGDFSQKQECQDVDFYAALAMIKVLIRHSSHVFTQLQGEEKTKQKKNKKELFLEGLPEKFNRQDFVTLAKSLSFTERTASSYINDFCEKGWIEKTQYNDYVKKMI